MFSEHAFLFCLNRPRAQLGYRLHLRPRARKHGVALKCSVHFLLLPGPIPKGQDLTEPRSGKRAG